MVVILMFGMISPRSGNKRVYKGNSSYKLQVTLYHISDEDTCHFAVITHINVRRNLAVHRSLPLS